MKNKALIVTLASVAVAAQAQAVIVYDNLSAPSAASAATSSTDLRETWGDAVTLTSGGILDSFTFTFFNSGSSTSAVSSATFQVLFYDNTTPYTSGSLAAALPYYGGFNTTLNFSTPLATGFYTTINVTGIAALNINLGTNLFITQQVTANTGGSRLGVVTFSTDVVGTGTASNFYVKTGATEGLTSFGAGTTNNNLGYKVDVVPEPTSMAALALGAAFIARRKRKN
jgi:hypothetical protein